MRAIALAPPGSVVAALVLLSCTRPNPAYEDTGSSGSGSGSGGSTGASTGASLSADETLGTASASGGTAVCGNGVVEGDEQCDDGNLVDEGTCSPLCRLSGEVEWVSEFDPTDGGPDRFNASTLHGSDLIAAGRGVPEAGGPHRAVVVRYDRENGDERSVGWVFEPWVESEAHAVITDNARLFISGPADRPNGTTTAFAVCFDVSDPDETPPPCWTRELLGTSSRAIDVIPSGVLVSVGHFNAAGHGLTVLEPQDGNPSWGWDVETGMRGGSQFEALARNGSGSVVAGMLDDEAIVAPVTQGSGTSSPLFEVYGTGQGEDRVQAMAVAGDDVVLGGWLDMAGSANDAWVGRYRLDGTEYWSATIDGGSDDSDEIEDLVIDEAGHVYAVGMLGEPSVATLWKLDGGSGELLWIRSYPELGDGPSVFRNVELSDDLFIVGEVVRGNNGVGFAMRIIP